MEAPMRGITTSTPLISTPRYIMCGLPGASTMVQRSVSSTRGRCPRCLMASTSRRVEYRERLRERMTTVFFARALRGTGEGAGGSTGRAGAFGRALADAFLDGTFLAG